MDDNARHRSSQTVNGVEAEESLVSGQSHCKDGWKLDVGGSES